MVEKDWLSLVLVDGFSFPFWVESMPCTEDWMLFNAESESPLSFLSLFYLLHSLIAVLLFLVVSKVVRLATSQIEK